MNNIFDDNEHATEFYENKLPYVLIALSLFALIVFVGMLFLSLKITKKIDVSDYVIDNESITYFLDHVNINGQGAYFEGWAFKKNESIRTVSSYFLLHDTNSDEYIRIPSMTVKRPQVAQVFGVAEQIDNCGIKAYLDMGILNREHIYELCLLYGNNDHKIIVKTGKRFKGNGELIDE